MSDPARVGELLPEVLQEVIQRAGPGYDRWAELVAQVGYCHHPIRLAGRVEQADRQTGEVRTTYDSEAEPDGVLLKACGTRRESRCPPAPRSTGPTPTSSWRPGCGAARGYRRRSASIRGCLSPSPPPRSARCTAGRRRGGWCCPATPTARAPPVPMAAAPAAGTATTPTTRAWANPSAQGAMTVRRRWCGTRWRPSCGATPPPTWTAPSPGWSASARRSCGGGCRHAAAVAVPAGAAAQGRAGGDEVPDPGRGRHAGRGDPAALPRPGPGRRVRRAADRGAGWTAAKPGGPAARDRHGGRDRRRGPGRAAHRAAQDPSEPAHGRAASVRG